MAKNRKPIFNKRSNGQYIENEVLNDSTFTLFKMLQTSLSFSF